MNERSGIEPFARDNGVESTVYSKALSGVVSHDGSSCFCTYIIHDTIKRMDSGCYHTVVKPSPAGRSPAETRHPGAADRRVKHPRTGLLEPDGDQDRARGGIRAPALGLYGDLNG